MFSQPKVNFCVVCSLLSTLTIFVVVGLGILLSLTDNSSANTVVLPLVINTWAFTNATTKAWDAIYSRNVTALDAVEIGCSACEEEQCDGTVGFGGSPDENGETTLDAFMMDGSTMNIGAVVALRRIKSAASVARRILENTQHSILAGELATEFARSVGFKEETLTTNRSKQIWTDWRNEECQPNYWTNVTPDPTKFCGPYKPKSQAKKKERNIEINKYNHDTISMLAIDSQRNIAAGTSSNGANHKIPGRVGDAPIVGAGAYADNTVGGAACTGDGDVMMRFLPSFLAVEEMRRGASPTEAAKTAIMRIAKYYPNFSGAIIVANIAGEYAAACHGMDSFPFSICNPNLGKVTVENVSCGNNV